MFLVFVFFFTIHKTISTWEHIVGDNLPVLICMVC